jgi:hypothetical protein
MFEGKSKILLSVLSFFALFPLFLGICFAQDENYLYEYIDQFIVDIEVNEDGSINVVEKILYDFRTEEKHGILRDIPLVYGDSGDEVKIRFSLEKVTD